MNLSPAILLTAAFLITGALATAVYLRDSDEVEAGALNSGSSQSSSPVSRPFRSKARPPGDDVRASSPQLSPDGLKAPSNPAPEFDPSESPVPAVANPGTMPSREELARRVDLIQRTSDARLEKLTRDLNLTEEQQHKVFAILARSSPSYHPSLRIGVPVPAKDGAAGGDKLRLLEPDASAGGEKPGVEDQIFDTLDAEQADLLAEQILERDLWWNDIVGLLERDIDRTLLPVDPAAKPPVTAPASPPVDSPSSADANREAVVPQNHGAGNLFDRLGGG